MGLAGEGDAAALAADSPPAPPGQAESWLSDSLTRSTVVLLAALCAVALLVPTAVSWSRHAGCGLHAAAQLDADYSREPPDNATLAICAIMKVPSDDPQWVDGRPEDVFEWLEYHKRLGVGRVYVIDHLSDVPLDAALHDYIASGYVQYEYSTIPGGPQTYHYNDCLVKFGSRHRYIAFIDNDEFFVLTDKRPGAPRSLPALLDRYNDIRPFGGLVVSWIMFGSSGQIKRPKGGVPANYWTCLERTIIHSRHVKTIVNTAYAAATENNPHAWTYKEPYYAIDEKFERADGAIMPEGRASVDKIALHHYVLKSLEDFESKERRGAGDGTHKGMDFFTMIDGMATQNCTGLLDTRSSSRISTQTAPRKMLG